MHDIRSRSAAVAVAVLVAAFLTGPPTRASAGPHCDTGYHCGWDIGFGTGKISFFDEDADFRDNRFSSGAVVDNNIKTVSNSTSTDYVSIWFTEVNWQGNWFCVNPGHWVENLPDDGIPGNGVGLANEASSMTLFAGGPQDFCY
ncbi:peptidase inhibitor family I36 protein [Lentzea sp.]|uniref:peptidase inhibitor family I36 protein n=1 Tax=Lentzea sp. TaxID=56099 RepID=UPI002ED6331C